MMAGMRNEEFGRIVEIWRIELASRFKLYDSEAVIAAFRKTYQIEALG
jgi:hypothetical protein